MHGERYEKVSQDRQLLADERDERLLRLVNNTKSLKLFDYVSNLLVIREVKRGDTDATDIVLDHLIEKRERVEEVISLQKQFDAITPDDDEIAFDEEVRIALFKPYGEDGTEQ